ncbi:MAG TPA: DinB family protein [Actinomycetota bacterium]|jgi:hypothetical protein|nr:DinB family protein [Actinomycetota bacterium]
MEFCDECGFRFDSVPRDRLADTIRSFGPAYADVLSKPVDALRAHPVEGVWSVLEYACHVRDVFRTQRERIAIALREDVPEFVPMGRDELPAADRYNEQDPAVVAAQLGDAADELADALDALDDSGWNRTGIYSWPVKAERTLDWVARNTVHEGKHHLMDVERLLS